uniref:integrator complex subunit 1 homolog isoform X2 n=1 Tax=Scatophagus argus TaxID=75038 RepID=UPI001ED7F893|nr:integrator complex subunit 1 homolog isoform X2 [Scatophagus argus]
MPIFVLTFVAVPWAASKAGRLIRSGLELIGTNSPRANPAESVPHDLPVIVPLPAQTYFQDRSFSGLRMLHQNNVRSPNQLPDENKQEKQEQDSTSATSKTDISSQSLKLPPFQDRSFSGLRMLHQNNVRSRTLLLDENKQEKQEQDSSFATSKIDISSQSELKMLQQNDDRSQTLLLDENKQEKQEQDSTSATSKTDISSQSLKLPRLALYMKRPTMTAVFSSTEEEFPAVFPQLKQQEMYFPGNKRELLISFPHPQQRLQLFYPESKEGWTIVLKRTEHQMRLLLPGHLQGLQMVFPLSKQELPVPFPRPVEELLLLFPQSGQGIRVFFPGLTGRIRAAFFGAQRRIIQVVSWTRSRIAAGLLSASEWTLTLTRSQTDSQSCLHTLSNNNNHNHNNNNNNNTNNN